MIINYSVGEIVWRFDIYLPTPPDCLPISNHEPPVCPPLIGDVRPRDGSSDELSSTIYSPIPKLGQ